MRGVHRFFFCVNNTPPIYQHGHVSDPRFRRQADIIVDFSGRYNFYSDFWSTYSYRNEDPDPSTDEPFLYLSGAGDGCDEWYMTGTIPSTIWAPGWEHYRLDPVSTADSETSNDW